MKVNLSNSTLARKASSLDRRALAFCHCTALFLYSAKAQRSGPWKDRDTRPRYSVVLEKPGDGHRPAATVWDSMETLCVTAGLG